MRLIRTTTEGILGASFLSFMHPMTGISYMVHHYTKILRTADGKRTTKDTVLIREM